MGDGHLNKCISCTKLDVASRLKEKAKDPLFKEKERKRGRDKFHRLYKGLSTGSPKAKSDYKKRYPEKISAHWAAESIENESSELEKHHWSYLKIHWMDIIFLLKHHHKKAHRFIVYDQERMMYRRFDTNELLDTKEKHESFIKMCIQTKDD